MINKLIFSDNFCKENQRAWEKEGNDFEKTERKTLTEDAEKVNYVIN